MGKKGIQLFLGVTFSLVGSLVLGGRRVLVFTAWPGLTRYCLWSHGAHVTVPGLAPHPWCRGVSPSAHAWWGEKLHPDSKPKAAFTPWVGPQCSVTMHLLYIWKLGTAEAFIPGIPKLEWVSGFTGSTNRGQKRPLANRAWCPPRHQAPPTRQPLLKKGERGDLTTHTGPISSGLSDHLV